MSKQMNTLLALLVACTTALAAAALQDTRGTRGNDLSVHEWGTFTSVAGPDGKAVEWSPLTGPSDLPCFVTLLNPTSLKVGAGGFLPTVKATVRMETPVLYFYSARETSVSASVRFPQGLITEWYPQADVPPVLPFVPLAQRIGGVSWHDVKVLPHAPGSFPVEAGQSHYYAARETDASPVQVGSQQEKFLFYRGLASFPVPLTATVERDGTVSVENTGGHEIPALVLFERRGSRMGYRVVRDVSAQVRLDPVALTGSLESLRHDLTAMLIGQGLYPREAAAMVETWRDSWFEEGARLFYVMPRAAVDAVLPLQIDPVPAQIARVFMGRVEFVTPAAQIEVERAIRSGDLQTLTRYGRYLEPIAQRIQARFSAADQSTVQAALRAVAAKAPSPGAACQPRVLTERERAHPVQSGGAR